MLLNNIFDEGDDKDYTAASGKMRLPNSNKSKWLYPFQWLWDTFFICAWNPNTAQSLFDATKFLEAQAPNGFCGHIRYNREILLKKEYFPAANIYYLNGLPAVGEITSRITQPPNIAYGLLELAKKIAHNGGDLFPLRSLFQKAYKYHEYIYNNRIIDGCMVTIHPWESGDDNSPKWDIIYQKLEKYILSIGNLEHIIIGWLESIGLTYDRVDLKIIKPTQRPTDPHYYAYLFLIYLYGQWNWKEETILKESPFRVLDPMTNGILLRSNMSLLELYHLLEISDHEKLNKINYWISTTKQGLINLWSKEHKMYLTKDLTDDTVIEVETVSGFTPLFSCGINKEHADTMAEKIILQIKENETKYFIPSTPIKETNYFEENRYWRGPVWVITNELIAEGLDYYGYKELSDFIRTNSLDLVLNTLDERGGFYEYYNPITGVGLGSASQSWTAVALLSAIEKINGPIVSDARYSNAANIGFVGRFGELESKL